MIKWYVTTMDAIEAEFSSKREAVTWCQATCVDYRGTSGISRIEPGFYRYTAPQEAKMRGGFWIGTRGLLLKHGFDYQLEAYEQR